MSEKGWRDRIVEALMGLGRPAPPPTLSNREALKRSDIPLDDFRMPGEAYREDRPGMQEQVDQRLRGPQVDPEIDPRLAPPLQGIFGIAPTNDRAVVDPDELPTERKYSSYRYRA